MDAPNASDRKSIRQQEKAARLAERERAEVITSIMSTLAGRRWLWDRLSECHIFHTTHIGGNPHESAYQEGRRSVGLSFLADIMAHCPDQYIQAMREANERYIQPNPNSAAVSDPTAERRGSPITDGGDSGTSADSGAGSEDPDATDTDPGWQNPGRDIYAPQA